MKPLSSMSTAALLTGLAQANKIKTLDLQAAKDGYAAKLTEQVSLATKAQEERLQTLEKQLKETDTAVQGVSFLLKLNVEAKC
jgi:hypothetical protein